MEKRHIQKEWRSLKYKERAYIAKNRCVKEKNWQKKIERYIPQKLNDSLDLAFFKAFEIVFEKGTGLIEMTYDRTKKEQEYMVNEHSVKLKSDRRSLKAFGKGAKNSKNINMAVSSVEGVGMGLIGMGLPDIPIFLGVLLKSIYEIALSYGYSYDSESEKIFILKIIEYSLSHDEKLIEGNDELDVWCKEPYEYEISRIEQEKNTAKALSNEMLYLKFIQGLPIVGVVGGISDVVYQKKIADYAELKYKRRFLEHKFGS